ncbi:hypothetical protein [Alkaliflexus imshenetskii]|uniref:hypothetical protein n=1 Tax=Alkaliflexus imshenetskii TaxID=286730 RepID=UPI00047B20F2|nr:hypothetical protein [Alkaliflexus imshenetskii]
MKKLLLPVQLIGLMLMFAFVFSACKMGRTSSGDASQTGEKLDKARIEQDVREFVYPLPTSFEVTEMLNRIGAAYILTLSNPVSNVERYLTEKSKAVNLGIYSADLSYATTYNQKQATIDYMNVSKKLIDALNISGAISPDIIEQIEAKQDNKEELVDLITTTFFDTYEHLNQSGRGAVSMLVLAGTWVESLYIATHISEDTYNNKEMVIIVMDQKKSLNKLMGIMDVVSENRAVAEVIEQLTPIHQIFTAIEDGSITERQMKQITSEIYTVRNQMVE